MCYKPTCVVVHICCILFAHAQNVMIHYWNLRQTLHGQFSKNSSASTSRCAPSQKLAEAVVNCIRMCVCMCVCMHVCVHACVCVHAYVCVHVCVLCVHMCVCMCVHVCVCVCVCVCVSLCNVFNLPYDYRLHNKVPLKLCARFLTKVIDNVISSQLMEGNPPLDRTDHVQW